jgi:thioredoxin 1
MNVRTYRAKTAAMGLILSSFLSLGSALFAEEGKAAPVSAKQAPLVTFIELGSVNCVPCKAMRPVMTDIETSYKGKVKVLFYDV